MHEKVNHDELLALCDRLENRGNSVLFKDQPEQRRDLLASAQAIRQFIENDLTRARWEEDGGFD